MSQTGKSANVQVRLNNKNLFPPVEWFDVDVLASFNDNIQANISTDEFIFILDAYAEIKDHIADGLNSGVGIFEGLKVSMSALNNVGSISTFEGFLDLQDDAVIDDVNRLIKSKIKKTNGLNTLDDRLRAIDFGLLESEGFFTQSDYIDVDYVVVKPDLIVESLLLSLMIFSINKQIYDMGRNFAEDIATVASQGLNYPSGTAAGAFYKALSLIFDAAYISLMTVQVIKLSKDLINALVQPKRTHKAIYLKTLLEKASQKLGYTFNTSVSDLDNVVYLPSNNNSDTYNDQSFISKVGAIEKGIPHVTDYGYSCFEIFELVKNKYFGLYAVSNGVIEFHAENSDFWIKQSSWILPDILETPYTYNTKELNATNLVAYATDLTDEYTIINYDSTSYQVNTKPKTTTNEAFSTIYGLNEVRLPVCLGNRKDSLNGLEKVLAFLAGVFDDLASVLFINLGLQKKVKSKIGALKVSNNNHSIPKLLWIEDGKMPSDHRQKLSAVTLWDKYHNYKSFVSNNYRRQRKVYNDVEVPFGLTDFALLIENSYFKTQDGRIGKVLNIAWNMAGDKAKLDYYIEEVYTTNLEETFINP